jgi:two-component system response regulator YesN
MYKLMVVDDEFNIRDGIANAIPWQNYDINVVGEASNGLEALKKVGELKPDIIITDIYMDNMDGLEFAEKLRQEFPEIKVIILSGYDEFEHAKRAIELKVFSYILKPILPDELLHIVKKVTKEIDEDRKLKEKMCSLEEELNSNKLALQEKLLSDLVEGKLTGSENIIRRLEFLDISLGKPFYCCLAFNIDGYFELLTLKSPKEMNILVLGIKRIICEVLGKHYTIHAISHDSGNVILTAGDLPKDDKNCWDNLYEYIEKVRDSISSVFGVTVTVGSGRIYSSTSDIWKSYSESVRALEHRVIVGKDCIINIDDVTSISGNSGIYPVDEELKIVESLNEEDMDRLRTSMDGFFKSLQEQNYLKDRLRVAVLQLFAVVARKLMDLGIDIYRIYDKYLIDPYAVVAKYDTIEEIKNWMINITSGAVQELQQDRKNNVKSVIKKAQEYIIHNFSKPDISLISIAEHVYLNPAYFSKLYKKETGESYVEFITKIRMDEAKKLLRESNARIADVGNAVGYPNAQYFCTLFKKNSGVSPAEYREGKQ